MDIIFACRSRKSLLAAVAVAAGRVRNLGIALAATAMLSTTVKFEGAMVLQAQSDGAISTFVAQASNQGKIRGIVKTRADIHSSSLTELFGQGQLIMSIDTGNGKPYQGIVPLQGDNLSQALQAYFEQSEQLKTRLWLFANDTHAAGLLLQALPSHENNHTIYYFFNFFGLC